MRPQQLCGLWFWQIKLFHLSPPVSITIDNHIWNRKTKKNAQSYQQPNVRGIDLDQLHGLGFLCRRRFLAINTTAPGPGLERFHRIVQSFQVDFFLRSTARLEGFVV